MRGRQALSVRAIPARNGEDGVLPGRVDRSIGRRTGRTDHHEIFRTAEVLDGPAVRINAILRPLAGRGSHRSFGRCCRQASA